MRQQAVTLSIVSQSEKISPRLGTFFPKVVTYIQLALFFLKDTLTEAQAVQKYIKLRPILSCLLCAPFKLIELGHRIQ